ncbi:MAG: tetratricopeptide repeat protein [Phycisphaerales bacterium]
MADWFDAERHIERAHEFYDMGRWDDAESELREALSLNPYRSEWHFNLGLTLEQAGRFAEAAGAFKDAHQLEPEDASSAMLVGVNQLRCGEVRQSIPWLETAHKLEPQDVSSLVYRIEAYARLGDHEQAEVMFYMAQEINPKEALAYAMLADSLLARGLHDKAVWCLREAAQLDAALPHIHSRLAEAYAATGRLERARQLYLRELRQNPGDVDTLLDLGCLLVDMNRASEASEKFRRVLELEPDNAHAHYYLGEIAERQGAIDEALAQFDVVLRLDPSFPGVRRRLASIRLSRGSRAGADAAAAHELLAGDFAAFSEDAARWTAEDIDDLGRLLITGKMFAEAVTVFRAAVERRPGSEEALHNLAVACLQSGERRAGVDLCREVVRLNPKHVRAMHNLAVAYFEDRNLTRARYWARSASLIEPEDVGLRRLRMKLLVFRAGEWLAKVGARAWSLVGRARSSAADAPPATVQQRQATRPLQAALHPGATDQRDEPEIRTTIE